MFNLLQTVINTIKARFVALWTMIYMWTNKTFVQTRVFTKIRLFFTSLFDVKPRNKKDYYGVMGWLISKRLAFAITIVIGVVSIYYLAVVNPITVFKSPGVKTYNYNSVALRFTKGNVNIKGKSGYLAYTGNVSKGTVTGSGILYNPEGAVIYTGKFENNKYNGAGKLYYDNGIMEYDGEFLDNLYEGKGILYRSNGNYEYEGEFAAGQKEGKGTLYDTANNKIYTGKFSNDTIAYSELIGKSTSEAADYYTGKSTVYYDSNYYAVYMNDINAVYYGKSTTDALDTGVNIDGVYVLDDTYRAGGVSCNNVSDLESYFGEPVYDGNTEIIMPEAIALENMSSKEGSELGSASAKLTKEFDNVFQVDSFENDYLVYIYTFEKDGLYYTFFCNGSNTQFAMYEINKAQ